ncbi:MAG: tyrosine-type recombinase/integrase [Bacillota bacterium]|jgi:integrase|nr:tyrosine-type recombinase/integrase [Bacillota bacterium]
MGYYEDLGNGKIKLIVSVGTGVHRKRSSKNVDIPGGRKRERDREIQRLLDEFEQSVITKEKVFGIVPTMQEFYDKWSEIKEDSLSQNSRDAHAYLSIRILDRFGDKRLSKITPMEIESFYADLRKEISPATNKLLSDRTILDHHSMLGRLFNAALDWDIIDKSPMRTVRRPKVSKKEQAVYNEKEVQEIFRLLEDEPCIKTKGIILLALTCALRRSEIAGLDIDDVDIDKSTIRISKAYVKTQTGPILKSTKSDKVSYIEAPGFVMEHLKALIRDSKEAQLFWGVTGEDARALFRQYGGSRIYPDSPGGIWTRWRKKHNLRSVSLHGLRHTAASILISKGVDVANVSRHLTHSKVSTTLDLYTKAIQKEGIVSGVFTDIYEMKKTV